MLCKCLFKIIFIAKLKGNSQNFMWKNIKNLNFLNFDTF